MKKKYLVTGGAGFIGSHIVEKLIKEENFVRVLDNFSSGKLSNLSFTSRDSPRGCTCGDAGKGTVPAFELIKGDIRNYKTCEKACTGIDYVIHQAALRSVPKSLVDPYSYNDVNITGTLNMLKAAYKAKAKRFVFASSSSVYGDTDKFPEKESELPLLISPYALSKLAGEYYCRIFSEIYGLETVCLRYFNVFGPRQALDDEYAVVIPKFITSILNNKKPPVFGNGKQSRDFTYVANVVSANFLAVRRPSIKCGVFNVANGKDNTVLELVALINKILKKNIKPEFLAKRPGDVFKTLADISQIKKKLGFKPLVNFEEGLRRTVEYFKSAVPGRRN
ncbi:MAG: SDR family oxidoreductase [Candidatus Omnitrophota bacterium]|nr:SDR family oxidoreductase [Candidatus Omnitrophota bacterium]MBU1929674.1 SDR family oxidoreductase [Candidatus Omnitrophota bacterium]MBU2034648.1 SDR family oxidoreductase [Candidatus Omnitrophota bacterium]MBU2257581.1 SDR family oxidoreductase [Candidatus Omnitrophota bacterium]